MEYPTKPVGGGVIKISGRKIRKARVWYLGGRCEGKYLGSRDFGGKCLRDTQLGGGRRGPG